MTILYWLSTVIARFMRPFAGRYRPERHYMRDAGPATRRSQRAG